MVEATARTRLRTNGFCPGRFVASVPGLRALLLTAGLVLIPGIVAAPVPVTVDAHVINFGNYDVNKGTYLMDMYVRFRYDTALAPEGFDPTRFEFANGRAASKDLLYDNITDGTRDIWFRIQANLYSEPRFGNYPFDEQTIGFQIEDAVRTVADLVYVVGEGGLALEEGVRIPGWTLSDPQVTVVDHAYSFGETYSQFSFQIQLSRPGISTALRSFLPPVAFVLVAGVSFLLHKSKSANRVTLGTGMLISAVAFHISQTSSLPTLGALTFFDRFMMAVYTFIVVTLAVSTYMAYEDDHRKDVDRSRELNRKGLVYAVVLPLAVFFGLGWL